MLVSPTMMAPYKRWSVRDCGDQMLHRCHYRDMLHNAIVITRELDYGQSTMKQAPQLKVSRKEERDLFLSLNALITIPIQCYSCGAFSSLGYNGYQNSLYFSWQCHCHALRTSACLPPSPCVLSDLALPLSCTLAVENRIHQL